MQFHVKRLRAFYLNWIRALYKFRYNNNNNIIKNLNNCREIENAVYCYNVNNLYNLQQFQLNW